MSSRPQGVTILAWLAIIGGVLGIFGAITLVLAGIAAMSIGVVAVGVTGAQEGGAAAGAGLFALLFAVWLFILAAVEIVFGVGALGLKPWAWTIGIWWCYISAASNVLGLFSKGGLFSALIGVLIALAILYYLYTDEVKGAFGKSAMARPGFLEPVFGMIDGQLHKTPAQQPAASPPVATPPAPPSDPNPPQPPA
jgi:hypothetical protein